MDVHATLDASCEPSALFAFVDDLVRYPQWVSLVHAAEPAGPVSADDGRPAWLVELRARLGPLARSKRLRMVRTLHDPERCLAVFERAEVDGRRHSPWVLRAEVTSAEGVATLHMHLHYGGGLWTGGVMERALAEQITAGRLRLLELAGVAR